MMLKGGYDTVRRAALFAALVGLGVLPVSGGAWANSGVGTTTQTVTLYASAPQARTGQAVTLMASSAQSLTQGQSLSIVDVTTGQTINTVTSGTEVSASIIHHNATSDQFAAVLTSRSAPLTVSWVARPIGNNAGYSNAAGQSVSLVYSSQAAAGLPYSVVAKPVGFTDPVYQFWWAMQGDAWHSSGAFKPNDTVTIRPPRDGFLSVVVYAREATAPAHENAAQQAQYEAKSDTALVSVGPPGSQGSPGSVSNPNGWVSLTTANQVAVGSTISMEASAYDMSDPVYQFWFQGPGKEWQSSGNYSARSSFQISAVTPGKWHVVVYARPGNAAANETLEQRQQSEAASPVDTVQVRS